MIFLPEQISKLNELETLVFDFIIKSPEEVQQMTIRDLASQVHVSRQQLFVYVQNLVLKVGLT